MELVDPSRIRLACGEASTQRIRSPEIVGFGTRTNDQSEGVVAMRLQIGYGDAVHRRDVLDVVVVGVDVLHLESVVLTAGRIPDQTNLRVVDLRRVDCRYRLGICKRKVEVGLESTF